jgi:RNA polymerase subunit RPABC4/transcription elongation factor Spt4
MFDKFKKDVGQAAAVAKWKADQFARSNKVQTEINNTKHQVTTVRDQIAGAILDMRQRGEQLPPEIESVCANIDGLMAQLSEQEARLAAINAEQAPGAAPTPAAPAAAAYGAPAAAATKVCPNCHTSVPAAAMFCTTCGFNFAQAPAAAPEKTTTTCPNCHFEVPATSAFCPNCGTRVVPA